MILTLSKTFCVLHWKHILQSKQQILQRCSDFIKWCNQKNPGSNLSNLDICIKHLCYDFFHHMPSTYQRYIHCSTGALRACCTSSDSENRLLDTNQKPFRVCHNWQEALNSNEIKQWRVEMKQGRWPTICKKCQTAEVSRGWSRRSMMLRIAEKKKYHTQRSQR